jgi:hypothetical protein
MTRKPILLTILTACLAATAMLATPSASAARPGGNGHYDCSQDRGTIRNMRYQNARMMQIYNYYDSYVTGLVNNAIAELDDNMGGDPVSLHAIASTAEMHLGWEAKEACYYLICVRTDYINPAFSSCPRLYGRNIAFNNSMKRRVALRQAELRDALNAALENALMDYPL